MKFDGAAALLYTSAFAISLALQGQRSHQLLNDKLQLNCLGM